MKHIYVYCLLILGYIMIWIQTYGAEKFKIIKNNDWFFIYLIAPVVVYLMVTGSRMGYTLMGSAWTIRLISFSINMVVFTGLSYFLLDEHITQKNIVCLVMSIVIILVQILWK